MNIKLYILIALTSITWTLNVNAKMRLQSCTMSDRGSPILDTSLCGWITKHSEPGGDNTQYTISGYANTPTCVVSHYLDYDGFCTPNPWVGITATKLGVACYSDTSGTAKRWYPHSIICFGESS